MIRIQAKHFLVLFVAVHFSNGFVPQYSSFRIRTSLAARYVPTPPPPPPGPPVPEPGTIERIMQEAAKALNELSNGKLPQFVDVSNVQEQIISALRIKLSDTTVLQEQIIALRTQIDLMDAKVIQEITAIATKLQSIVVNEYPQMSPLVLKIQNILEPQLQITSGITLLVASVLSLMFAGSLFDYYQRGPSKPYPTGRYDAESARAYFDRRLPVVMARGLSILLQSLQFGVGVLSDIVL